MDTFQSTIEKVGMAVDAIGVLVIVGGILVATVRTLFFTAPPHLDRFTAYRQNLGRAILLIAQGEAPRGPLAGLGLRPQVAVVFSVPDLQPGDFAIARIPGRGKVRRIAKFVFNALRNHAQAQILAETQGSGEAVVAGR